MPSLRSALNDLASDFADDVLAAIRSASLEDLRDPGPRGAQPLALSSYLWLTGQKQGAIDGPSPSPSPSPSPKALPRRSPEDVAKTLAGVLGLLSTKKAGLRSEEIRAALKLDKRELPRVLYEGLRAKRLRSEGQKRATTYFAR
jgi:hypothetical protein